MNEQIPFGTGAEQSPFDYRDKYVAAAVTAAAEAKGEAPIVIDLSVFKVLMQGLRPACVSHAWALRMRIWWYHKTGKIVLFSPRFLDALAKKYDGLGLVGTGTYPRLVCKLSAQFGCATEDVLPNDITLSDTEYRNPAILTDAVMANAAQYKIPGYVWSDTDVDSMRKSMRLFGPLSVLFRIGKEWWTGTDGVSSYDPAKIMPLRPPAVIVSGHQVVVHASTDDDLNTLRNSWDAGWGFGGDGKYHPEDYAPFTIEAWNIAELPANIADLLKNLPSPSDFHFKWSTDLHFGMPQNDDVKFAQIALMILGFLDPASVPANELGYFGNKTAAAVLKYQQSKRIARPSAHDIGPMTRGFLNADFAV